MLNHSTMCQQYTHKHTDATHCTDEYDDAMPFIRAVLHLTYLFIWLRACLWVYCVASIHPLTISN
jgi:hypothetical protein